MHDLSLVAADHTSIIKLGAWKFLGNFTAVDLIAATTNALNGALLARRPDHCRDFTVVGIVRGAAPTPPLLQTMRAMAAAVAVPNIAASSR